MKILQEIALTVFAILVLIFAILTSVILFGWLNFEDLNMILQTAIAVEWVKNVILTLNAIFIIIALVCIFYDGEKKSSTKDGILMENEKGNLLISRNALTKIINSIVNEFESAKVENTTISLDNEGSLIIDIQISVTQNAIIKELTSNLQSKVKEAIKKSSDLEVKTVNIGIQSVIEQENTHQE